MRFLRPLAYGVGSLVSLIALLLGKYPDDSDDITPFSLFLFVWFCGTAALCQFITAVFSLTGQQRRVVTYTGYGIGSIPLFFIGIWLIERIVRALP